MYSLNFFKRKVVFYVLGVIVILIFLHFLFLSAPADFPAGSIISIEQGMNLRNVSQKLKEEHIIRSRILFEAFIIIYGGEKHLVSSDYLLENKLPVYELARRLERGESHLAPVKVIIPEGFDIAEIAEAFSLRLTNFNKSNFFFKTEGKEGYLFPDTYFFLTRADEEDVIKSMSFNFEKRIKPLRSEILKSGKKEQDIITMASIIEREAKGELGKDDRSVISGILWKRISIGMPLQADAAPETYETRGLPKSPISNPGLLAIKAAIYPVTSPYLYYLHDKEGNIHYAKNFEEHKLNKFKYLK